MVAESGMYLFPGINAYMLQKYTIFGCWGSLMRYVDRCLTTTVCICGGFAGQNFVIPLPFLCIFAWPEGTAPVKGKQEWVFLRSCMLALIPIFLKLCLLFMNGEDGIDWA